MSGQPGHAVPPWAKTIGAILVVAVSLFGAVGSWLVNRIVHNIEILEKRQVEADRIIATMAAKVSEMDDRIDRLVEREERAIDRLSDRIDKLEAAAVSKTIAP